jgi:hypothetical protein
MSELVCRATRSGVMGSATPRSFESLLTHESLRP